MLFLRNQKIALVTAIALLVLYVGYRAWHAGGFENLLNELRGFGPNSNEALMPTASPTPPPTQTPAPVIVVPPPVSPSPTAVTPTGKSAVIVRVNQRRAEASTAALVENAVLTREAQEHASDMAQRGFFDHTSPDGVTFQQRMAVSGYASGTVAENLGLSSGNDATVVVGLWMQSQGHRENMLNPAYTAVGIGIATGTWQGRQSTFVVAIFGAAR